MVLPGQGILAADESNGTMGKRLGPLGIDNTEDNRRNYRQMLFTSDEAMNNNISGVILFEEIAASEDKYDGTPFVEIIRKAGAVPGIKVDQGVQPLPGHKGETVTVGLDELAAKLKNHYETGARFAKWRAVISIDRALPSWGGIKANAHALARYAALCQDAGIVPIVEPEVQMDGDPGDHSIERCHEVTSATLKAVFSELDEQNVKLEGIVLKPNMVVPGSNATKQASPEEVAEHTVAVLKRHVPSAVPGIAFLSGGQSDIEATANLNAMNVGHSIPWALTYSYGRALQAAAREAWGGKAENLPAASKAFAHRARMNGLAAKGEWNEGLEA